jgi:putative chitinase
MTINWLRAQQRLNAAGYAVSTPDGIPGRMTMTALFAHTARRQPDATLRAIGASAATVLPRHGISDTPARLAEFLGETANETGGYTRFEENLHYSARRLLQIWPSRFPTLEAAAPYAWDPSDPDREDVALADMVYGSRMGNEANGTHDDDGWDHRGGGMLQHTGAAEYALLLQRVGLSSDDVRDPAKSVIAAADFWDRRSVNAACDAGQFERARRLVNGGVIGLATVATYRTAALAILS